MKILILGDGMPAAVAAFAYSVSAPINSRIAVVTPSGVINGPSDNEYIAAVIPNMAQLAKKRPVRIRSMGQARDWATKVERPDRMLERFTETDQVFAAHLASEVFAALTPFIMRAVLEWPTGMSFDELVDVHEAPDLIVNTGDPALVCLDAMSHASIYRTTYASDQIGPHLDEGHILLNAEDSPAWFSSSKMGGRQVTRWAMKPPFNTYKIVEPIHTNCACSPHDTVAVGPTALANPVITLNDVFSSVSGLVRAHLEAAK